MLNNNRTDGISTGIVVWQSKNLQVAQGGFTLDDASFSVGDIIPVGVPIGFNESTRMAKVAKIGVAQASATNSATTYKVLKGHVLKVGMSVKTGASGSQAITEIDTTNSLYDEITLGATLGVVVAVGAEIFVDDDGYTNQKGLLYANVEIGANGLADVSVVLRGTVYARRIAPVSTVLKGKMPLIIFSESF